MLKKESFASWNYNEFLIKCNQPHYSNSINLEMMGKTRSSFLKISFQKHMKIIWAVMVVHKIHTKNLMDQIDGGCHLGICAGAESSKCQKKPKKNKKGTDQPTNQPTNQLTDGQTKKGVESHSLRLLHSFSIKTKSKLHASMLTKSCVLVAISLHCISLWYLVEKVMSWVHSMYSTITKLWFFLGW